MLDTMTLADVVLFAEPLEEVDLIESRVDLRIPWRCTAEVSFRGHSLRMRTLNVSASGLFLEGTRFPEVGESVELRFQLEPEGRECRLHGTVRHVRVAESALDVPPGFGLEMASLAEETRELWIQFIQYVARDSRTRILAAEVVQALTGLLPPRSSAAGQAGVGNAAAGDLAALLEGSDES
jgi:hypothetical protein